MNTEYLKNRKKELNLTYDEISRIANVPKRTIVDIFLGNTPHPREDTLKAIEKALSISSDPSDCADQEVTNLTEDETRLLTLFREMKLKNKSIFLDLAEILAKDN